VWHASVSLRDRTGPLHQPRAIEAHAVAALAGVGDTTGEWWIYRAGPRVGHLRVAVTPAELNLVPAGFVTMDAGDTGPRRRRSL